MNPFDVLGITPTKDKIAIRRAYVQQTKTHHPDQGGDPEYFNLIQQAYEILVKGDYKIDKIVHEVYIPLKNLMEGCIATAAIDSDQTLVEFTIPPFSYPNDVIEFYDQNALNKKIRIRLKEQKTKKFRRINNNIAHVIHINKNTAFNGTKCTIDNFDGHVHTVEIPPKTSADRLIHQFPGHGFYNRGSTERGSMIVIIKIQN